MVVFTCDGCNETLKKNKVDAHAARCRRCDSVTCVDCLVSFYGDDYRQHTSCMTEAERYEKTMYNKSNNKKKKNPQEAWMDLIQSATASAPSSLQSYMKRIANLDNVPRKEKQFRNFVANSLNLRGKNAETIVDSLWKHLSALRTTQQEQQQQEKNSDKKCDAKPSSNSEASKELIESQESHTRQQQQQQQQQHTNNSNRNKEAKDKRKKMDYEEADNMECIEKREETMELTPKTVRKTMRRVLKKTSSMKIKDLRSAVHGALGLDKASKKKLKELIQKQLGSRKIKVDGKIVSLA